MKKSSLRTQHGLALTEQWSIVAGKMVPHDDIRIIIPGQIMGQFHVLLFTPGRVPTGIEEIEVQQAMWEDLVGIEEIEVQQAM